MSGSTSEPEMSADKFIVAEKRKYANCLESRVQILIDPALTDDEKEQRADMGTHDSMEINGEPAEEKARESSDKPTGRAPGGGTEVVQGTDSAVYSGTKGVTALWEILTGSHPYTCFLLCFAHFILFYIYPILKSVS